MIRNVMSFDPGKHSVAWARFNDGALAEAGLIRFDNGHGTPDLTQFRATPAWVPTRALIELPQVYGRAGRGGKGDPNDLIDVAVTVGRIAQAIGPHLTAELVRPRVWKGNVPADVMLARIEKRLDVSELHVVDRAPMPKSLKHNVVDAIGLGLWALGRL